MAKVSHLKRNFANLTFALLTTFGGWALSYAWQAPPWWYAVVATAMVLGALAVLVPKGLIRTIAPIGLVGPGLIVAAIGNPWLWLASALGWFGAAMLADTAGRWNATEPPPERVSWDKGDQQCTQAMPNSKQVTARLDALNGSDRTMVSVHLDGSRFDVCCPSPGKYWVFHTAQNTNAEPTQLIPNQPNTGNVVDARIGGQPFQYPDNLFIDQQTMLTAYTYFWENQGTKDPKLTWDQGDRHHEILYPPPLDQLC